MNRPITTLFMLMSVDGKIATRSVFYDETGKRARTKKEITGESGQIREGCTVIKKGEAYETHLFTAKDDAFKNALFLGEAKAFYTALIEQYNRDLAAWERQAAEKTNPKRERPPEKESILKKLREYDAEAKRRNDARRQQSRPRIHDYDRGR